MEEIEIDHPLFEPLTDEGCSVRFVDEMNFTHVEQDATRQRRTFVDWWPVTARVLIQGAFGDKDDKRAAIHSFVPILDDFPSMQPTTIRMTTPELAALHNLYSSRLMYEEQHIRKVKERWSNAVFATIDRIRRLLADHAQVIEALKARSKTLAEAHATNMEARKIVAAILERFATRLRRELDLEVRLVRAENLAIEPVRRPETRQLDERIAKSLHTLEDSDGGERLTRLYEMHVRNVEHDVALELQKECHASWLDAYRD